MAKKPLTVMDATKDELIEFCFNPFEVRGVLMKEQFLLWLERKRNGELLSALELSIDSSQKYFQEYIEYVEAANDEDDIEKKLEILEKANKAYEMYEKAEKQYNKLDKKLAENMSI